LNIHLRYCISGLRNEFIGLLFQTFFADGFHCSVIETIWVA
jgi:hypothetical protein